MMKIWRQWPNSDCPRCGEHEDSLHVWKCQEPAARMTWERSIAKLRLWMLQQKTQVGICHAICGYLNSWRNGDQLLPATSSFLGLRQAIESQNRIGWRALLEGCVSVYWQEVQQRYYEWVGSRRTGRRWVSQLILKLWEVAWDLWEHRNGYVHQHQVPYGSIQGLIPAIHSQLQAGHLRLAPQDQALFSAGASLVDSTNTSIQLAWLQHITTARERAARRDQASFGAERQFLRRWLDGAQ